MTNDSHLFKTEAGAGRLPLFTGKMFHQFSLTTEHSGYWIDESDGRKKFLGKQVDNGKKLDYQGYRWLHRRIAGNTNERTFISTITPKNVFTEVNSTTLKVAETGISHQEMLFFCAVSNSFVLDYFLRQKVTTTLNMFYIYQLPVSRLTATDPIFNEIVQRAAQLICTTPDYDDLRDELNQSGFKILTGETDPKQRAQLRAELDALIAHLYGLTPTEFEHVLNSFPLVTDEIKQLVMREFQKIK
ncbi:hypothetical protein [Beggiatoa leptomitoformis]|uniref:Uncharacterized protein n=1 Tax=Beggiatoa leptomitoformis TaxID=288004 RepID=A0A2N9YAM3_9GAMM|nr:hypothetical protein [Beggiatoa leptomitoformis]ALG67091.1 hypothetical protein AL038_04400 [Beggiatoa leptomitoformis]AUI67516.1 hypothetical protein BLE401_01605 [Beggiatoa leptomitoformis]